MRKTPESTPRVRNIQYCHKFQAGKAQYEPTNQWASSVPQMLTKSREQQCPLPGGKGVAGYPWVPQIVPMATIYSSSEVLSLKWRDIAFDWSIIVLSWYELQWWGTKCSCTPTLDEEMSETILGRWEIVKSIKQAPLIEISQTTCTIHTESKLLRIVYKT